MSIVFKGKKGAGTITIEGNRAVVGTRSTCDLAVDDPMVAEAHLAIERVEGGFCVEDLGTSSGTYLNGLPLEPRGSLRTDGENVIVFGVSKLLAAVDPESGAVTCTLKEQSFFYDKKEDPLKWSKYEVELGRFRFLKVSNLVALALVGLLLALCFIDRVEQPLVNPGPLASFHDAAYLTAHSPELVASIQRQGLEPSDCRICHDSFRGTPAEKCATCHEPIFSPDRHPFEWEGLSCQPCHVDHRGVDRQDLTSLKSSATCAQCHDADKEPTARALATGEVTRLPIQLSFAAFPHDKHTKAGPNGETMACATCHVFAETPQPASFAEGKPRREFASIRYESCAECHRTGGQAGTQWNLDWHGSEAKDGESSKCLECHKDVKSSERKQAQRVTKESALDSLTMFSLRVRMHEKEMASHRDLPSDSCHLCHRDEKILISRLDDRRFLHGLHLSTVDPASPRHSMVDGECRECHQDVLSGAGALQLTSGLYTHGFTSCTPCHDDGSLAPTRANRQSLTMVRRNDFPHAMHLDRSKPGLEAGCASCHEVSGELHDPSSPSTTIEAMSCTPCHTQHKNVAGGDCSLCHPAGDVSFLGGSVTKLWPAPNHFSHRGRGHDGECATCHGSLEGVTNLLEVPIPDESHPSCIQCHVKEKARFHFGR
jgi:pSer/pThr/pTyr-binding forkhead associated (FHA) protein